MREDKSVCVCVCVCGYMRVCGWKGKREKSLRDKYWEKIREREKERERERECVCLCLCEKERVWVTEKVREIEEGQIYSEWKRGRERVCVCVCVCVLCARGREREKKSLEMKSIVCVRERERERGREGALWNCRKVLLKFSLWLVHS